MKKDQACSSVCWQTDKSLFISFDNSYGINTPTVVEFKLLTVSQAAHKFFNFINRLS